MGVADLVGPIEPFMIPHVLLLIIGWVCNIIDRKPKPEPVVIDDFEPGEFKY